MQRDARRRRAATALGAAMYALFAGFVRGDDMPYAFIVVVENGGYGTETAGTVANTVLQKIKEVKGN